MHDQQEPPKAGLLTDSVLLPRRRYRNPGRHALGHGGIIAWWVCAVVPHRCRRRRGCRRHANVRGGGEPEWGHIEKYPPMRMGIKTMDMPKLVVWDEMTMAKTATAEPTMPTSGEASMSPPVPRARIGIGYASHQ